MDPDRVSSLLSSIGVEVTGVRGSEISGLCPGHKKITGKTDHSPSWSLNADKQTHHCFSCGYSGSLLTLVAELRGLTAKYGDWDYDAARAFIEENLQVTLPEILARLDRVGDGIIRPSKPVPMTEARLAIYDAPPAWALDARHLTADACAHFGVLWDDKAANWILPLRDPDTKALLGWQEKGQGTRHFHNRPAGLAKSRTLFGLDVWTGPGMLVLESPLDAVRAHGLGIPAVATCGAIASAAQVRLIQAADPIIVAFDNPGVDDAGRAALQRMFHDARAQSFDFRAFNYGGSPAKDIGDMTDDEIRWGVDNAVHCLRGLRAMSAA